ncbi:hypothetical protein ZHAS_00014733 [Anopheles sinensis]|uniref:Uncharacterized protein n=1 Tax=Anopheles sinensis TaxID=74873 RepID=A0A084W8Y7_ANOSI|nr:hypothetical protein ZHAS_00014733 [Anopheles sinensis]
MYVNDSCRIFRVVQFVVGDEGCLKDISCTDSNTPPLLRFDTRLPPDGVSKKIERILEMISCAGGTWNV